MLKLDSNIIFQTSKSYVDIFPQNKLIYLTNNSETIMETFDESKIYIIGAIVDFENDNEFELSSYEQAKIDEIKTLKINDRYFPKNIKNTDVLSVYNTFKILTKFYFNKIEK